MDTIKDRVLRATTRHVEICLLHCCTDWSLVNLVRVERRVRRPVASAIALLMRGKDGHDEP